MQQILDNYATSTNKQRRWPMCEELSDLHSRVRVLANVKLPILEKKFKRHHLEGALSTCFNCFPRGKAVSSPQQIPAWPFRLDGEHG